MHYISLTDSIYFEKYINRINHFSTDVIHWSRQGRLTPRHLNQSWFWTSFCLAFLAWCQTWDSAPCCGWPECTDQCCCSAGHCWRPKRLNLTQSERDQALVSSWASHKIPCACSWQGTDSVFLENECDAWFAPEESLLLLHWPETGSVTLYLASPFLPHHPPLHPPPGLRTFLELRGCL